jgi:hypothetical protein
MCVATPTRDREREDRPINRARNPRLAVLRMKGIRTAAYEYIAKREVVSTSINMDFDHTNALSRHCTAIFIAVKKRSPHVVMSVTGRFPESPAVSTQRSVIISASATKAKAVPPTKRAALAKKPIPTAQSTIETKLLIRMELPTSGRRAARTVTKIRLLLMATESSCLSDKLVGDHAVGASNPVGTMVLFGATSMRKLKATKENKTQKAQAPGLS